MKYCKKCDKEAPDSAEHCDQCGGKLSTRDDGGEQFAAQLDLNNADPEQLRRMLNSLESDVQKQEKKIGKLRIITAALVVGLVALLIGMHFLRVMRYATMKSVVIQKDASAPGTVVITYSPASEGRIDFARMCGGKREDLAEHLTAPLVNEFNFKWAGQKEGGYDVHVIYRRGIFLKKEKRHFDD